jgi:3-oxoacyl-[acyl-carrier protein] reductase
MIILTGASGGIGQDLIKYLSKMGDVVGLYNKTSPEGSCAKNVTYEHLDIENTDEIASFAKKWGSKDPKVTLVHAAALKIDGLAAGYKEDDWDKVMNVNLRGNFLLTRAFLPFMIENKWGRIIHISSAGALQGALGTLAYSTSKSGLIGMSRVLAKEYARFDITSNVLVLGHFKGGMFDVLADGVKEDLLNQVPSKSLGDISNVANAIEFLIKSKYVTGSAIHIDGGI